MISLSLARFRKNRVVPDHSFAKRRVTHSSELSWVAAEHNPWKVPVLDLQPQTYFTSSKPQGFQVLENLQRISRADGTEFDQCKLRPTKKLTECDLSFPVEGKLLEGILFRPTKLDHKWGIFFRGDRIVCVNTWNPEQITISKASQKDGTLSVSQIEGTFLPETKETNQNEPTDRILNFLLRTHNMNETFPAPILPPMGATSSAIDIANSSFENFGSYAEYATDKEVKLESMRPLRTITFLHLAARRGDLEVLEKLLKQEGASLMLKDYLGCTPSYHAVFSPNFDEMIDLIFSKGVQIDNPVTESGSTLLMVATETGDLNKVSYLVEKGANVNAQDSNGFTALHRAAEMGHLQIVQYLMKTGAAYSSVNNLHTPYSLAALQGQEQITSFLKGYGYSQ